MNLEFHNIGIAINTSPNCHNILKNAKLFNEKFDSHLHFFNLSDDISAEQKIAKLITDFGIKDSEFSVTILKKNSIAAEILEFSSKMNFDLLIMGASNKEKFPNNYLGSISRTLLRNSPCSVLVVTTNSQVSGYESICTNYDFTPESDYTLLTANNFANKLDISSHYLLREIELNGLSSSLFASEGNVSIESLKESIESDEVDKLSKHLTQIKILNKNITSVILFGKSGWKSLEFAKTTNIDLFFTYRPNKKLSFWDRIFVHDIEYLINDLPCNIFMFVNK